MILINDNDRVTEPTEVWSNRITNDGDTKSEAILTIRKYIPEALVEQYCNSALKPAILRELDNRTWFADIPGFHGVWANENTPVDCVTVLREALQDWLLLKIEHEDRDIPIVDDIDLNVI
jgi:predicted RNase H-like HicB family nuclease